MGELNESENYWKAHKVPAFVAPTSIPMMRVTIQSTIDIVDYLLKERKYDFVLTGKFNQDCLEV